MLLPMKKTTFNRFLLCNLIGLMGVVVSGWGHASDARRSADIEIIVESHQPPITPIVPVDVEKDLPFVVGSYHEVSPSPLKNASFKESFLSQRNTNVPKDKMPDSAPTEKNIFLDNQSRTECPAEEGDLISAYLSEIHSASDTSIVTLLTMGKDAPTVSETTNDQSHTNGRLSTEPLNAQSDDESTTSEDSDHELDAFFACDDIRFSDDD